MKTCRSILNILFVTLVTALKSQAQIPNPIPIESYHLEVSDVKTSNLIFPFSIKSVDIGSRDVLVQKANGVENILQVKANLQYFQETNLSVITADGRFYSFTVNYSCNPLLLNFSFSNDSLSRTNKAQVDGQVRDEEYLKLTAYLITQQPAFLNKRSSNQLLTLNLRAIYIKDGLMWYLFEMENDSYIDFSTESIRCFVKDKRQSKRTAIQEREILPVFKDNGSAIPGKKSQALVLAFPFFVAGRDKKLVIKITEANSGRFMSLEIQDRQMLRARAIE